MNPKKALNLEKYKNQWVALSEDCKRIIASHKNLEIAVKEAQKKGVDDPVIVNASAFCSSFIL